MGVCICSECFKLCCCSVPKSRPNLCNPVDCSSPGFLCTSLSPWVCLNSCSLTLDAIQASHSLLPLFLWPSIFPSIRVFSNESALHIKWPKYWIFSFSISPSNEFSGLISFRMDWLDVLAVPGTLKSLLQHHSMKASVLYTQPSLWSKSHINTWLLEKP